MKHYRIIRESEKALSVSTYCGREHSKIVEKEWYIAKQRFLWIFWLSIGHVVEDCLFFEDIVEHKTSTKQEMEEYLHNWHEVYYGKEGYIIDYKDE